jgi:hypothetical protein
VSLVTNNIYSFFIFYASLVIANFISSFIISIIIGSIKSSQISFFDINLLTFNFNKGINPYVTLFVFAYTISYILYTSIIVQQIILSQIYILLFLFSYFISNIVYMVLTQYQTMFNNKGTIFINILSGLIFGFGFAYCIDHYINYNLLFFSTYKVRNTQLRCKNTNSTT